MTRSKKRRSQKPTEREVESMSVLTAPEDGLISDATRTLVMDIEEGDELATQDVTNLIGFVDAARFTNGETIKKILGALASTPTTDLGAVMAYARTLVASPDIHRRFAGRRLLNVLRLLLNEKRRREALSDDDSGLVESLNQLDEVDQP